MFVGRKAVGFIMMVISIKKAVTIMLVLTLTMTFLLFADNNAITVGSFTGRTIVVDPGHGLPDGGAVGKSGVPESELNLKVAKHLEEILTSKGFNVILTRRDEYGIYSPDSKTVRNKKREDMKKRVDITNTSGASLLVSIHMNYFSMESCQGPQVFYLKGSEKSKEAAESIRESIIKNIGEHCTREIKPVSSGIYLLSHTKTPAVLIECGFLSNTEEEKLLITDKYQKKMAASIAEGIKNLFPKKPY